MTALLLIVVFQISVAHAAGFSDGPYGSAPYDIAAPFVIPTLDGDWDFRANWSDNDCYVFIMYAQGHSYGDPLWKSSVAGMLNSPSSNVHYFFLSYAENTLTAKSDVLGMKSRVDDAFSKMSQGQRDHWSSRVHFVEKPARSLDGWVGDVVRRTGYFVFSIDRFQRLRPAGLFGFLGSPLLPELSFAANEVRYFNYEWDLQQRLSGSNDLVIPIIRDDSTAGARYSGAVMLPDAATMASFDNMEIELSLDCLHRADKPCFEWDYLVNLYLCDDADTSQCDREMGRWVTAYGREGHWVTDISDFLPWLLDGGEKHFRLVASDPWIVNARLRLSNRGKGRSPFKIVPLWQGGPLDENYNDTKPTISFTVPDGTAGAELVAIISGHGWGSEVANCAEFCNHQHYFQVNDSEYIKEFPQAGTQTGCMDRIKDGAVPNQYGTWYLGRGGWCPGKDVELFTADVTSALKPGENQIDYGVFVDGSVYHPVPSGSGQGFGARIDMNSYLVFWRAQTSDVDNPDSENDLPLLSIAPSVPNPVTGAATVNYRVPGTGHVVLRLIDNIGRVVRTLVDQDLIAGYHSVELRSAGLVRGVYHLQIEAGGMVEVAKIVVEE